MRPNVRSGLCGTARTRANGCRIDRYRQPRAGGTSLRNECTQRLGGPDSREIEESAPRHSEHAADNKRDGPGARSRRRWYPLARSSESTPGTSRSAVPPLEHPQCKGAPDGLTPGARRQLASPRVLQWSARGRIAPKPSLRSVSFFFSGFGLAITSYPPIPKDVDYNLPSIGLLG